MVEVRQQNMRGIRMHGVKSTKNEQRVFLKGNQERCCKEAAS